MMTLWRRVTRTQRCPICDHSDWCSLTEDGDWAICRRMDTGEGLHKVDKAGGDYWLYRLAARARVPRLQHPEPPAQPIQVRASDDVLDPVYRTLLASLSLSGPHHAQLRRWGLSDEEIRWRQYRTLPSQRRAELARGLVDRFGPKVCRQIPGLHIKEDRGRRWWSLAGAAGLVIPLRTPAQHIVALSLRADDPVADARYSFVSSRKYGGPGPSARLHWPLYEGPITESVRLTEGALKGDVATVLGGQLTLGLPGVSGWQQAIPLLRQLLLPCVRLAFDADACKNLMVARALKATVKTLTVAQIKVQLEVWDEADGKGIDDLLANGEVPTVLEGREMWAAINRAIRSAWLVDPLRMAQWWQHRQRRYEHRLRLPAGEVSNGNC
jgi:Domain of unknown function (DUF3854)